MSYKDYLSIGINHHLLCKFLATDSRSHCQTLIPLLEDRRFDVFDLWIVGEEPYKSMEIRAIRECGRPIIYNVGDRDGQPQAFPSSCDPNERAYAIDTFKREISGGLEAGTKKIVTSSGPRKGNSYQDAFAALVDFYCRICDFVPDDVMVLIEPTDVDFDKRFLIGSSRESVRLVEAVRSCGYRNFSTMIDMCHLPQLNETVEQAMKETAGYLQHIHLGTCVVQDKSNPFYGDKHPGWGVDGTCWGEEELAQLLVLGLESGYFSRSSKGTASFEMVAYDGMHYLKSPDIFFDYLERAWNTAAEHVGL